MSKTLKITPIKTDIFYHGQELVDFISQSLGPHAIAERSILAVTSKIISLAEGRTVPQKSIDKHQLIIKEADYDLGEVAFGCRLTIKDGLFIPSAGIDESNSVHGDFILYPADPFQSAKTLHQEILRKYSIQNLGILITDSHTLPLRQGVTGIALAYWGFSGIRNLIGTKDLFQRELKMTKMDLADGLASAAVLMMGEADECCPLALIENAPVEFQMETNPYEIQINPKDDLYFPLYENRILTVK